MNGYVKIYRAIAAFDRDKRTMYFSDKGYTNPIEKAIEEFKRVYPGCKGEVIVEEFICQGTVEFSYLSGYKETFDRMIVKSLPIIVFNAVV